MADVTVSVHFDPCALDSHEWRRLSYGLGRMFGAETCHSCGETRYPDDRPIGGIDRSVTEFWASYKYQ